ncbi:hypothetical protein AB0F17_11975 [Nonomuraea sp. NPDC026600]|uniref:hypothetical protein n=1 Tax=Nonomuraea sp. NPDC026600 TaxID=3155363 RepID=UPI0033C618BE
MRRGILAAIPLALALALTGCGAEAGGGADVASVSSGKPAAAAPSASAGEDRAAKGLKFAQCMREHGVPMDDPEPGKGVLLKMDNSISPETAQKAQEACKEYAPSGGGPGGKVDPKMAEQMRKYSQCMRDSGVEAFPDPDGGMLRMDSAAGEDPDFKAAQEKCKEFMPGMRQGGS